MLNQIFFGAILILLGLSFSYGRYALDRRDGRFLRAAMSLTLCADFCMLLLDQNLFGLCLFCLVQIIYTMRYAGRRLVLRLLVAAVTLSVLIGFLLEVPLMVKVGGVYALCFGFSLASVVRAFREKKYPAPNRYLTLLGMFFFALCDICVLFYNLGYGIAQPFIWVFYLPAQLMLALSAKEFQKT